MSDIAYQLLQPSINLGLDEFKFWDMTVAEIERYIDGAMYRMKQRAQFDYILADLVGISSARMMSKDVKFPTLMEAYSHLYDKELAEAKKHEQEEEIATQNSINRFLEFAMRHNSKMREEEGVDA